MFPASIRYLFGFLRAFGSLESLHQAKWDTVNGRDPYVCKGDYGWEGALTQTAWASIRSPLINAASLRRP